MNTNINLPVLLPEAYSPEEAASFVQCLQSIIVKAKTVRFNNGRSVVYTRKDVKFRELAESCGGYAAEEGQPVENQPQQLTSES